MTFVASPSLQAPNVLEVDVDFSVVSEFIQLLDPRVSARHLCCVRPNWNSDICWLSPETLDAFRFFQCRFNRLGLASHVLPCLDIEQGVRMYSGFLVTRSHCNASNFHVDWLGTGNQAFTMLTPITGSADDFGLLYKRFDGSVATYRYRPGKALIFGDDFLHSTQPGRSAQPVALLSFTFGSDRMEHWPRISLTAAAQGSLFRLPDGRFHVRDFDDPQALAQVTLQAD